MADPAGIRLDTADLADGSGWRVTSTDHTDEFSRDGVRITVHYTAGDDIDGAVKRGPDGELEVIEHTTAGKLDVIRFWLTGRSPEAAALPLTELIRGLKIGQDGANPWDPQEFFDAVTDPADRAFLRRILELVHANAQLPAAGDYWDLCFGQYPGGAMFVYPSMRRFPPYKFKVHRSGRLMVSGCWRSRFKVTGHPGFAELAALLDLDHTGPAPSIPVAGLDPDELWEIGERVSRAINA